MAYHSLRKSDSRVLLYAQFAHPHMMQQDNRMLLSAVLRHRSKTGKGRGKRETWESEVEGSPMG